MTLMWIDIISDDCIKIVWAILVTLLWFFIFRQRKFNRHRHNRMKSKKILQKIRSFPFTGQRITYLRMIDPFVFEELLLDAFKAKGFNVVRNKRYTGDEGIDGVVWKNGTKYLIQAKRYKGHINVKHVTEFIALVESHKCHGFFCHTGKTGPKSKQVVQNYGNITILSGQSLIDLISESSLDK